jgi:hypothetical protein
MSIAAVEEAAIRAHDVSVALKGTQKQQADDCLVNVEI